MKTKIDIKSWLTGSVLFEYESERNTIKETLQRAVTCGADLGGAYLRGADLSSADLSGADLSGADLSGADLRGADLRDAYLSSADLSGADLRGADLSGADLSGAYLSGADLGGAYLRGAYLSGAYLSGADLSGAYLSGAYLRGAYLSGADLSGADLRSHKIKDLPAWYVNLASRDMLFIFRSLPSELPFLKKKILAGEIDGTQYGGDCACLVGTLANADGGLDNVCEAIPYYDKGLHNPAEQWFYQIHKGDTPKNNEFAKHALMLVNMVLKANKTKEVEV